MKITVEKQEKSQVLLDIEVEQHEVDKSLDKAYRRLVQKVNVPGFRRGKTPRPILERHIGKGALLEEALEHLIPETYDQAIREQNIVPIAQPKVEVMSLEPIKFKALVPVRPTVKLCDYAGIRVEPRPVDVTDESVDKTMEQLRLHHGSWTPADRPVQYGDSITMAMESKVGDKTIVDEKDVPYRAVEGNDLPLPGFVEKLVGAAREQELEFDLPFPDTHPAKEFHGQLAHFRVKIGEVKEQKLPALDDEFAKSLGAGVEDLASLRDKVKADLAKRAEMQEKNRVEEEAVGRLVECAQVEYPEVLLEAEIGRTLRQQEEFLARSGKKMEDFLKETNKTIDQLASELRPDAEKRLLRSLVVGQLAEEEKIEVTPDEINAEVEKMTRDAGDKAEQIRKLFEMPSARDSLENNLLRRKTVERLVEIAGRNRAAEAAVTAPATEGEVEKEEEEKGA